MALKNAKNESLGHFLCKLKIAGKKRRIRRQKWAKNSAPFSLSLSAAVIEFNFFMFAAVLWAAHFMRHFGRVKIYELPQLYRMSQWALEEVSFDLHYAFI